MALPDITNLTPEELSALISTASAAYSAALAVAEQEQQDRRQEAGETVAVLEALLGPDDTDPYDPATGANMTINGVLAHDSEDHAVLAANAGLALSLILRAIRVDVKAGINIARIIAGGTP